MLRILIILSLLCSPAFAKDYSGSEWQDDTAKVYDGAAWVEATKNYYMYTAEWVEIEASAPPVGDGLLGNNTEPTSWTTPVNNSSDDGFVVPFNVDDHGTPGTVRWIHWYGNSVSSSQTICGIYTADGSALLVETDLVAPGSEGWMHKELDNDYVLEAGTVYLLSCSSGSYNDQTGVTVEDVSWTAKIPNMNGSSLPSSVNPATGEAGNSALMPTIYVDNSPAGSIP